MNMKYIIVLADGMADDSPPTPMECASTPTLDSLVPQSEIGLVQTVPEGFSPGSDIANLSVLGYAPKIYYTGRAPLEAVSLGIELAATSICYRANLVTLSDSGKGNMVMADYSGGEIDTASAKILIDYLNEHLPLDKFGLYSGFSYRHCLVDNTGATLAKTVPPHDISGQAIKPHLPSDKRLLELMQQSYQLLSNHPLNIERVKQGKRPSNSLWLWGGGTRPNLDSFYELNGVKGAVISAVDLLKGIAIASQMTAVNVQGATGTLHTNWHGKLVATLDALKTHDFVYLHIEAADECGHQGDRAGKIKSIENIDKLIIKELLASLQCDYRLLVLPDHPTPLSRKTHTNAPVPYLLYDSTTRYNRGSTATGHSERLVAPKRFNEISALQTNILLPDGTTLLKKLLNKKN